MTDTNLDDLSIYPTLDPSDMRASIRQLPISCLDAWSEAAKLELPENYGNVNGVLIIGMGGSAIGGDLIAAFAGGECRVPIIVHRGYDLPAWINEKTLVITSSYSGNTEETLSAFDMALKSGAKCLVITSGGKLRDSAEKAGIPIFIITYRCQPRAALAFSLFPILNFLSRLHLIHEKDADISEVAVVLEQFAAKLAPEAGLIRNLAKETTLKVHGKIPVILGAEMTSLVAYRWETQINENAKSFALSESFPELDQNSIVGYKFPQDLTQHIVVVMLRANMLSERVRLRYVLTARILQQAKIQVVGIDGRGISPLTQMMSLVLLGDYVSYYRAILNQIDPTPGKGYRFSQERTFTPEC